MLTYKNHSDTLIIVLHEMYGINGHIAGVCKDLADLGLDVVCPDLLDGKSAYDYAREEETSFDPFELQKELSGKENTEIHILKGKHGFADPYSPHYNEMSAKEADRITKEFLKKIRGI